MKKIFTLLVALIFSLTMMTSVSAIGLTPIEDESKLYIETATVPSNVTSYAADIFMHMGKPVWANFGISDSQLSNLTLSQGFRMISVNTMQYSDIAYYFLIYAGDSVVAIMTISNVNGELGFQIERNLLTVDISEKLKNSAQPYRIYVSDNAYYFIQNNQIIHVSSDDNLSDKDSIVNDCAKITSSLSTYSDLISTAATDINVPVAKCSFVNDINVEFNSDFCVVVHVNNIKCDCYIVDSNGNRIKDSQWTCWASCTASLCYYYKCNGKDLYTEDDINNASLLRQTIIDERMANNNDDLTTRISDTVPIINEKLPLYGCYIDYAYRSSKLPWNLVTTGIGCNTPSITGWFYYDSDVEKYTEGHAMVLCGYSFAYDPYLEQYQLIYMMDPNTQPYTTDQGGKVYPLAAVGYNDNYIIRDLPFEWMNTACQSYHQQ